MTPIADCLTLPSDKVLDHATVDQILLSGFSRIPIHEPGQKDNFIGMLLVKRVSCCTRRTELIYSSSPIRLKTTSRFLNSLYYLYPRLDLISIVSRLWITSRPVELICCSVAKLQVRGVELLVSSAVCPLWSHLCYADGLVEDLIEEIIGEEIVS
jgi:hypothetical protein